MNSIQLSSHINITEDNICTAENTYPIVGGAPVTLTSGGGCATAMWLCCDGAKGIGKDTWNKTQ
jgi:hypothetical protein